MFENFIRFLIAIVLIAACYFLGVWVLEQLGIVIPHMVLVCLGIIAVLVIILIAWRMFGGLLGGFTLFPPRNPPQPPKRPF
jgi:amino acid transporter